MQKKLILDSDLLRVTIDRLCQELIENHGAFDSTVLLGLQPRGIFLAERIREKLSQALDKDVPLGYLDATFHRDDFRRREEPPKASETRVPFLIEGKQVILIDDVLYTGRTVRAALDAMIAFGRPEKVELLVLIDRRRTRELPISANYVGQYVNTLDTQKVLVEMDSDHQHNRIWLINKE
ncbi:MAG: bifunctional pyr operon transcriptional regulator/uracil phosphoribosyltransferase PyrR [Cyclobacteriaceae bacterium]|nr:bifunctional pyr operon transcriptional regulator/uracil phosphoribosyltransferase PyrR [Cyclobacteriaceae bacterium]